MGRALAIVFGVSTLGAADACVAAAPPKAAPVPMVVAVDTPSPTPSATAAPEVPPPPLVESAPPPELPRTWSEPTLPALGFMEARGRARALGDAFDHLAPPKASADAGDARKAWFGAAVTLVDQSSRYYAAAFHASDASREDRVEVLADAADLDAAFVRRLDDLGLVTMPAAWRSDPSVRVTFEDVANGPLRRFRDEARALAHRCIDLATETAVATDAVKRCLAIRAGAPAKVARRGDASSECPCAPGDPLCSASIGGWCAGHGP